MAILPQSLWKGGGVWASQWSQELRATHGKQVLGEGPYKTLAQKTPIMVLSLGPWVQVHDGKPLVVGPLPMGVRPGTAQRNNVGHPLP